MIENDLSPTEAGSEEDRRLTKKEQLLLRREAKEQRREEAADRAKHTKMLVAVGIGLGTIGIVWWISASVKAPSDVGGTFADPTKGSATSTVVLTEYADFQCPACAAVYPAIKDIIEEYGDRIRYVYNDFPLTQHKYGTPAAIGAQCALQQEKFFEYHDMLYENQTDWAAAENTDAAQAIFTQYAEAVGMDMNAFNSCVTSDAAADVVNEDIAEGRTMRVNSTPTFFVNDKRITSTPFSANIKQALDEALGATNQ